MGPRDSQRRTPPVRSGTNQDPGARKRHVSQHGRHNKNNTVWPGDVLPRYANHALTSAYLEQQEVEASDGANDALYLTKVHENKGDSAVAGARGRQAFVRFCNYVLKHDPSSVDMFRTLHFTGSEATASVLAIPYEGEAHEKVSDSGGLGCVDGNAERLLVGSGPRLGRPRRWRRWSWGRAARLDHSTRQRCSGLSPCHGWAGAPCAGFLCG
jgi:hypothetical protein